MTFVAGPTRSRTQRATSGHIGTHVWFRRIVGLILAGIRIPFFGLNLSLDRDADAPLSLNLFPGGDHGVIAKADLPPNASINQSATEALRAQAASMPGAPGAVATATAASGYRPNPGPVPPPTEDFSTDPLRFQLLIGGNLTYTPRTGYGTPFSILRSLASAAPVPALCIQTRKDQMASLDWDFAPKDKKAKGPEVEAKLKRAREFFAKPDRVTPFQTWIQTLIDEVLAVDALSIYKRRDRKGDLYGYEIIDGATIKVLVDERGLTPQPPNIAYRQIIYGQPVTGGDCRTDELLYRPKNVRTWTPYGMSPIETILLIVTADLNRAMFNAAYYTDGNIPEALVGVPDQWNPKQIKQFQDYWDLVLKGDPQNRSRLRFVVQTMAKSIHEFRKPDFTTAYDLWLLKLQCACYGVTPSEIGFTDDVNKATAKSQGDVNQRRGVKPMARFTKGILDEMLVDLDLADLEATFSGGEGDDALTQAKIIDLGLRNGRRQLDEVRAEDGLPAIGLGPGMITATGFVSFATDPNDPDVVDDPNNPTDPTDPTDPAAADEAASRADQLAQEADLKKYQTVALKAVKAGKRVPAFTSAVIPSVTLALLSNWLAHAATADDVRKVFRRVMKAQRLSKTQQKHSKRMTKRLTSVLASMRRELADHIGSGVEA